MMAPSPATSIGPEKAHPISGPVPRLSRTTSVHRTRKGAATSRRLPLVHHSGPADQQGNSEEQPRPVGHASSADSQVAGSIVAQSISVHPRADAQASMAEQSVSL